MAPAKAALGAGGCLDCHRFGSPFFEGAVLAQSFDPRDGKPRWMPNYQILGLSPFMVKAGAFREEWIKPVLYGLIAFLGLLVVTLGLRRLAVRQGAIKGRSATIAAWILLAVGLGCGLIAAATPGLPAYVAVRRFTLDANHFLIAQAARSSSGSSRREVV